MKDAIKEEQKLHVTNYGYVDSLFDTYNTESYFITSEGHFHIKYDNGYEVSLFNGLGSYTDNLRIENEKNVFSKYMEVAIIKDGHFVTRDFFTGITLLQYWYHVIAVLVSRYCSTGITLLQYWYQ